MSTAIAFPRNTANTFLTHIFGTGLVDERYVVERFKARADGDIRPWSGEGAKAGKGRSGAKRVTATLKAVKGTPPGAHRDHHLHGVAHPGWDAGLGRHRHLDVPRPQVQGLSGPLRASRRSRTGRGVLRLESHPPARRTTDVRPGHRAPRPSATSSATTGGPRSAARRAVPQVRQAPARTPSQSVRAVHREAPPGRPRALPPAHRRACRPGPVPEVRQAPAGARAQPVRTVPGEGRRRRPGPGRKAAGRRDAAPRPGTATAYEREWRHRQTAERREAGLCPECGEAPPAPERTVCAPCGEKRREKARASYARGKAEGSSTAGARSRPGAASGASAAPSAWPHGSPPACARAAASGLRSRTAPHASPAGRRAGRSSASATPSAGPPACAAPAGGRRSTAARGAVRARCARPSAATPRSGTPPRAGSTRSAGRRGFAPTAASPRRGRPGASRARAGPTSARPTSGGCRSIRRSTPSSSSDTGDDHGTFDSWEDVALCLAFARLSLDQVEVLTDQSPVATWAAWE